MKYYRNALKKKITLSLNDRSRARRINNSYKSEGQLPQDPDIQDLKLYMGKIKNIWKIIY